MNIEGKRVLRMMAWQRAKGELKSMLYAFNHMSDSNDAAEEVIKFIEKIEEDDLLKMWT